MTVPEGTAVLKEVTQISGQTDTYFSKYPVPDVQEHGPPALPPLALMPSDVQTAKPTE